MRGFRDADQRLAVVATFGRWLHRSGCGFTTVTSRGPSHAAQLGLDTGMGPNNNKLSSGQLVLLSVMLDVWDGGARTLMIDLVDLTGDRMTAVGELVVALSKQPAEVDRWVAKYAQRDTEGRGKEVQR